MARPRRRQHVVDVLFVAAVAQVVVHAALGAILFAVLISRLSAALLARAFRVAAFEPPELGDSAQLVLEHLLVLVDQAAHVSFQSARRINRTHRKAQLNVVFGIGADDEVDIAPVSQKSPLDVAHDVGQVLAIDGLKGLVRLRCDEITVQLFRVVDPSGTEHFKGAGFVWVIFTEVANVTLLLVCAPQVACERVLVLVYSLLKWHRLERRFPMQIGLFLFGCFPLLS